MFWLTFIVLSLALAAEVIKNRLEFKAKDEHRFWRISLNYIFLGGFITALILTWRSNSEHHNEVQELKEQNDQQTAELKSMLQPVLELAHTKYPSLTSSEGIHKLTREFRDLKAQVSNFQETSGPWHLTNEQLIKLRNFPTPIHKSPIKVVPDAFDGESGIYATQLAKALKSAGWNTVISGNCLEGFRGITMLSVRTTPPDFFPLFDYLHNIGLPMIKHEIGQGTLSVTTDPGDIIIVVGLRPLPAE
jgi:hypothetical protein